MRTLISAAILALALLLNVAPAQAACSSPTDYTVGDHSGATDQVMCRGDAVCYSNQCYGRCGPGCNWSILGNHYTSACTTHDGCIKTQMCSYGNSSATAQANCVGLLPAAIGSLGLSAWYDGANWIQDAATSVWTSIRRIF